MYELFILGSHNNFWNQLNQGGKLLGLNPILSSGSQAVTCMYLSANESRMRALLIEKHSAIALF